MATTFATTGTTTGRADGSTKPLNKSQRMTLFADLEAVLDKVTASIGKVEAVHYFAGKRAELLSQVETERDAQLAAAKAAAHDAKPPPAKRSRKVAPKTKAGDEVTDDTTAEGASASSHESASALVDDASTGAVKSAKKTPTAATEAQHAELEAAARELDIMPPAKDGKTPGMRAKAVIKSAGLTLPSNPVKEGKDKASPVTFEQLLKVLTDAVAAKAAATEGTATTE